MARVSHAFSGAALPLKALSSNSLRMNGTVAVQAETTASRMKARAMRRQCRTM